MASNKKNKKSANNQEGFKDVKDYYALNTSAVDRLVNANKDNVPKFSDEELKKYKADKKHLPAWLKVLFIKFWFAGAMCFFFFWGLGTYLEYYDLVIVFGIALGFANDLLVNPLLRFCENAPGGNNKYMMFTGKKYYTLVANVIYSAVVLILIIYIYNLINYLYLNFLGGTSDKVIAVEPFLFGFLYMAIDSGFVALKNLGKRILQDAKDQQRTK